MKTFFNLFLIFILSWPCVSLAAKKYRYIKREHGVQFQGSFPTSISQQQMAATGDLRGAYSYNWEGWVEFGPYFGLQASFIPAPAIKGWKAGLMAEYNFIKNRGRRKFIPSIGLSFGGENSAGAAGGVDLSQGGLSLAMGAYGALKIFVGKRTPFTIKLAYVVLTPMSAPFQPTSMTHRIEPAMGFSYYFDFY